MRTRVAGATRAVGAGAVLVVTLLVAVAWSAGSAIPAIQYHHTVSRAEAKLKRYISILTDEPREVMAIIIDKEHMPSPYTLAYVTRAVLWREGLRPEDHEIKLPREWCVMRFTPWSVKLDNTLAHEACHCAFDFDVINDYGYKPGMPLGEKALREHRAEVCADWLTDRGWVADLERRNRRVPEHVRKLGWRVPGDPSWTVWKEGRGWHGERQR